MDGPLPNRISQILPKTRLTEDILSLDMIKPFCYLTGAKLFGLQMEQNFLKCGNETLLNNNIDSKTVDRTVISTYGSFIAKSLSEWSKQVISLTQSHKFKPM